jgi:hypothetical protein
VRTGLERLNLQTRSISGSQSPSAGSHSKQKKPFRPRGGAKDVWTFFQKALGNQICILCQCVKHLTHSLT